MIFGAMVFNKGKFENSLKIVMIISGVLSLIGLIGVPLANMNIRNIGIIGYTLFAIITFILMAIIFNKKPGKFSKKLANTN